MDKLMLILQIILLLISVGASWAFLFCLIEGICEGFRDYGKWIVLTIGIILGANFVEYLLDGFSIILKFNHWCFSGGACVMLFYYLIQGISEGFRDYGKQIVLTIGIIIILGVVSFMGDVENSGFMLGMIGCFGSVVLYFLIFLINGISKVFRDYDKQIVLTIGIILGVFFVLFLLAAISYLIYSIHWIMFAKWDLFGVFENSHPEQLTILFSSLGTWLLFALIGIIIIIITLESDSKSKKQ